MSRFAVLDDVDNAMATKAAQAGDHIAESASNAADGGNGHLSYAEALSRPEGSSPGFGHDTTSNGREATPNQSRHSQNGTRESSEAGNIGSSEKINDHEDVPRPKPIDDPATKAPPTRISYAQVAKQASKQKPGDIAFPKLSGNAALVNGISNETSKEKNARKHDQDRPRRYSKDATRQLGVRWAPFYGVSVARRMQTLAVLVHCSILLTSVPAFFFCCGNPLLWVFIIPYLLHVVYTNPGADGKLSWRSKRFRSLWIWKHFAGFFPAQLHKTHDLPDNRKYIFGYHPHGIIGHGAWAAFATEGLGFGEKFPGIVNSLLTLDSNFNIPFYREYLLMAGVRSVSRVSIKNHLSMGGPDGQGSGRAVTIVVGGARESLEAQPGTLRLVIKDRVGFVKMAMRTGADLVPVLGFGENDLYDQLSGQEHPMLHKMQIMIMKVFKFTLPFMRGRGIFNYDVGLLPYRRPLNIVVGKPIPVTPSSNDLVDPVEVDRLHGLYCGELQKLWDTYKDEFAENRKEELKFLV